ncbi:hypothetical protein ACO0QE_000961 [Hanseniaspora vineae]
MFILKSGIQRFSSCSILEKSSEARKLLTLVNSSSPTSAYDDVDRSSSTHKINQSDLKQTKHEHAVEKGVTLVQNASEANKTKKKPEWLVQKLALKSKFEHWNPTKKLSRDEMDNVRLLKEKMPYLNNTDIGNHFKISPEAVRRILKSRFSPKTERERQGLEDRWIRRGERIQAQLGELAQQSRRASPAQKTQFPTKQTRYFKKDSEEISKKFQNKKQLKVLENLKKISL